MNFLNQLLRGIAFVPALVNGIEALFGGKSGIQKKDAAMSFLENALATVDAVAARGRHSSAITIVPRRKWGNTQWRVPPKLFFHPLRYSADEALSDLFAPSFQILLHQCHEL